MSELTQEEVSFELKRVSSLCKTKMFQYKKKNNEKWKNFYVSQNVLIIVGTIIITIFTNYNQLIKYV